MRKLGTVGIALVGLMAVVQAVGLLMFPLAALVPLPSDRLAALAFFVSLVPPVIAAALGTLLIVWRNPLAARWFDESESELAVDPVKLMHIGLILIGITLLAESVPSFFVTLAGWLSVGTRTRLDLGGSSVADYGFTTAAPALARSAAQALIGAWLAFGSTRLATRLVGGPLPPALEPAQPEPEHRCAGCGTPYDPDDYRGGIAEPKCDHCGQPLDVILGA